MRSMRVSNPRMREIQTEMEQSDIVRLVFDARNLNHNVLLLYLQSDQVRHCFLTVFFYRKDMFQFKGCF